MSDVRERIPENVRLTDLAEETVIEMARRVRLLDKRHHRVLDGFCACGRRFAECPDRRILDGERVS